MAYQTKKGTKCTVGTGRRERLVESPRTVDGPVLGEEVCTGHDPEVVTQHLSQSKFSINV
jgi:hypothetical protein